MYNAHWGGAQWTKPITIPKHCTLHNSASKHSYTKSLGGAQWTKPITSQSLHPELFRMHTFLNNAHWGGAQWTKPITGQTNAPWIIPHLHIPMHYTLGRCTVDQTNNRSNQCTLHYSASTHCYTYHTRWGGAQWTKPITGQINAPCIISHPHIAIHTIHAGEVHSGPNQ